MIFPSGKLGIHDTKQFLLKFIKGSGFTVLKNLNLLYIKNSTDNQIHREQFLDPNLIPLTTESKEIELLPGQDEIVLCLNS